MKAWIVQLAISFALRQLSKWQGKIDWNIVKADLAARVKDLVPGEFFDSEAVQMCLAVVDAVAAALSATEDLEKIIKFLVDQKFPEAWEALRDLILKVWQPVTPAEKKVYQCVEDCKSVA
jgi:hypothetical protein